MVRGCKRYLVSSKFFAGDRVPGRIGVRAASHASADPYPPEALSDRLRPVALRLNRVSRRLARLTPAEAPAHQLHPSQDLAMPFRRVLRPKHGVSSVRLYSASNSLDAFLQDL
jgi:hypothetical protein